MDGITAMARKTGGYDPMALPDTFTVYNYANEDIRAFLHPHWHNYKAIHPMWYLFLGMLYFCIGKSFSVRSLTVQLKKKEKKKKRKSNPLN